MEEERSFNIGDVVIILDRIDLESKITAVVRLIEADEYFDDVYYLYLAAEDDSLNDKFDPRVGNYWDLIVSSSEYIMS